MFRLLVADLDSPSYFVASAAVELGFFKQQGVDVEFQFNVKDGPERLRDGRIDFFGGPAYAATRAFPAWRGARLLCALSQYSYWFMGVRADLDVKRGDINAVKGRRISSSSAWPGMGLRHMLKQAGIDLERDNVSILGTPPTRGDKGWMGHSGVEAIQQGATDFFWGNGMRVALAESVGIGKLHLDLRRGDGPAGARFYNFAALTTSERLIEAHPEAAAGAVRAIVQTQKALKQNPSLATEVGNRLFPPDEALLIAELVARDAPFYDARISQEAVDGLNAFGNATGLFNETVPYDRLVATQFRHLWNG
jgi:NitT/TauT family transport system substrate-binding protein